jgi:hypothetical protein
LIFIGTSEKEQNQAKNGKKGSFSIHINQKSVKKVVFMGSINFVLTGRQKKLIKKGTL